MEWAVGSPAALLELLWLRSCFWLSLEGEVSLLYHAGASGHVKLPVAITEIDSSWATHLPRSRFGPPMDS